MSAIFTRLMGDHTVIVWEKRPIVPRSRQNIVDASESYKDVQGHPGTLPLLAALGILDVGFHGNWAYQAFKRAGEDGSIFEYIKEVDSTSMQGVQGELEWEVQHTIAQLEQSLMTICHILEVAL